MKKILLSAVAALLSTVALAQQQPATMAVNIANPQTLSVLDATGQFVPIGTFPPGGPFSFSGGGGGQTIAANWTSALVSCPSTPPAALVVAARTTRVSLTLMNSAGTPITIGPTSGVTVGAGFLLPPSLPTPLPLPISSAVYCIVPAGSSPISVIETYN